MQRGFLQGILSVDFNAFSVYNFAPPSLRRNIGILGLIHKRVLGLAHTEFEKFMPFVPASYYESRVRPRHNKMLSTRRSDIIYRHAIFNRSIFGSVDIYNRLPQWLVDIDSVSGFQHELTAIAKTRCDNGIEDWQFSFSPVGNMAEIYAIE